MKFLNVFSISKKKYFLTILIFFIAAVLLFPYGAKAGFFKELKTGEVFSSFKYSIKEFSNELFRLPALVKGGGALINTQAPA